MKDGIEDAACIARCLQGDSSAFEPLVARYQRVLFSVALRLVGNHEDAKDATQNAFVRAYANLDRFDPAHKFFSWIYRIVVNECLNVRRGRKPQEQLLDQFQTNGGSFEALEAAERREWIDAAIKRLTDDQREVIVLRHFADLSYEEIGEAIGVPEKTVKSRLFSARQRLGELLGGPQEGAR